jgi:hypothetical protein
MTSHCSRKLFIRPSMSHQISRWRRAERWQEELRRVLIFRLGNVGLRHELGCGPSYRLGGTM